MRTSVYSNLLHVGDAARVPCRVPRADTLVGAVWNIWLMILVARSDVAAGLYTTKVADADTELRSWRALKMEATEGR